jgi:Zn-finger nucleic acid-binding protein
MSDAEVRHCPVCGAPVAVHAPRCDYCHAPLASVHCAACFTLNPWDAVHCLGCGQKLGLEPLEVPSLLRCPSCDLPFRAFSGGAGTLGECTACGGQFVEHALLADLLERRELYRVVPRALPARENPARSPVHYLPCPVCTKRMNRNNFGGTSGVVVDVCAQHGIWFDPGELPRILEFVQAGGLERARERARHEHDEVERARRVAAATPTLDTVRVSTDDAGEPWRSLAKDALELCEFVVETLRKRF